MTADLSLERIRPRSIAPLRPRTCVHNHALWTLLTTPPRRQETFRGINRRFLGEHCHRRIHLNDVLTVTGSLQIARSLKCQSSDRPCDDTENCYTPDELMRNEYEI